MNKQEDPRLAVTRTNALSAARDVLQEVGVLAVTHAEISLRTGISRSTLYRHWPKLEDLRNDAILEALSDVPSPPKTDGPLAADLAWNLQRLMAALNDTAWGHIAPQVAAAAAKDQGAQKVINEFMNIRIEAVEDAFLAAKTRGEISDGAHIRDLAIMTISVPYFRKLFAGLPIDKKWLSNHINLIVSMAVGSSGK